MRAWDERALSLAVVVATLALHARASAQEPAWDVPCAERDAFVAAVAELGGSFDGFEIEVGVTGTEPGSFRGRLLIRRGGETLVTRELEDERCADVVDALAIAAALALRSLPPPEAAPVIAEAEPPRAPAPEPPAPEPPPMPEPSRSTAARVALGASLRGGLGPTPEPALAPGAILALEVDRFFSALTLSYWPDAAALLADGSRGVSLWALSASVELGYRIGDELSVTPCLVIEPSVTGARGVGVEQPRAEAAFVLDAGLAAWLAIDLLDRVRLFARGDVLFGLVRPAYGVDAEVAFAAPTIRGSGGAGVLVLF